ncbi:hypothetical protein H6G89_28900 [Oscillatoria sp. FACHB-1407]|uniref:hypothetical protein n=1 Tax=Oscillatoria sp. FACHB-1407 TaxID=2692847 RepID=UPI001682F9AB|nr:hypothetical protein [Oscillatoria sp. FACHB-1407]MBD2465029.1 hypothetical protein [Oscillatoria sp. FACHB-1407]
MKTSTVNPSVTNPKPTQVSIANPTPIEPPSAWMQYGTSPTEIILATAVMITAIAGVIGAIALLLQVLVPVMRSIQTPKQE